MKQASLKAVVRLRLYEIPRRGSFTEEGSRAWVITGPRRVLLMCNTYTVYNGDNGSILALQ